MQDTLRIVRGRTATSQNALLDGFRYSKDSKPSTVTGKQAWRCIVRSCKGRLHTLDGTLVAVTHEHNHGSDLADCEVRATLSAMKDLATSSSTANHLIYSQTTGNISRSIRLKLPSAAACKKQAQRARRGARPYPESSTVTYPESSTVTSPESSTVTTPEPSPLTVDLISSLEDVLLEVISCSLFGELQHNSEL